MHNLQLSEDQEMIVDTVRRFVADVVAANAQELDEHRTFVREQFDALAELGVFGLTVPEAHGGAGMGLVPFVAALEAVGMHSSSLARLWIGQAQCATALAAAGGGHGLDAVVGGGELAVFVGPEHASTLANGRLRGRARVLPAGGHAQRFVVAAMDGATPVLAVAAADGAKATALRSLGLGSAACAAVAFDGAAEVVATGDAAGDAIAAAQRTAWIGVAATAIGGGLGAIAAARRHAGERIAFGKPLLVQEAVQRKLVETRRAVEAARQLTWHAARIADLGEQSPEVAITARLAAADAMIAAADEAIQIHGGFGYTVEYHVERHYRDGMTLEVLDGGGEHLRQRLATLQLA
jgi:butyryl-CoA dehydrogenase